VGERSIFLFLEETYKYIKRYTTPLFDYIPHMSNVLFVSAFLDIGRSTWETPYRVDSSQYIQYIEPMLLTIPQLMLFLEGGLYDHFVNLFGNDRIKPYHPPQTLMSHADTDQRILQSSPFQEKCRALYPEGTLRPIELTHPLANIMGHNKVHFLKRAMDLRGGEPTHYVWIDVHYFRFADIPYWLVGGGYDFYETQIVMGILSGDSPHVFHTQSPSLEERMNAPKKWVQCHTAALIVPKAMVDVLYTRYQGVYAEHHQRGLLNSDGAFHAVLCQRFPSDYRVMGMSQPGSFFRTVYRECVANRYQVDAPSTLGEDRGRELQSMMSTFQAYGEYQREYAMYYEGLFQKVRGKRMSVLAVGNWPKNVGNPIEMWRMYFHHPETRCYGANMNTGSHSTASCRTYNINQFDKWGLMMFDRYALHNMCEHLEGEKYDLLFNSFSTAYGDNAGIFETTFCRLKKDGIYVIEQVENGNGQETMEEWIHQKVLPVYSDVTYRRVALSDGKHSVYVIQRHPVENACDSVIHTLPLLERLQPVIPSLDYEKVRVYQQYLSTKTHALEVGTGNWVNLFTLLTVNRTIHVDYLIIGQYDGKGLQTLNEMFQNRIKVIPFSALKILDGEFITEEYSKTFRGKQYDVIDVNVNGMIGVMSVDMRLYDFLLGMMSPDCVWMYNGYRDRQVQHLLKKEFQLVEHFYYSNYVIGRHVEEKYNLLDPEQRHVYIITSVIHTEGGTFDPETRLKQTLETLQTVKQKDPNAILFLVEGSEYNWYANQFGNDIQLIYSPPVTKLNKSLGEVTMMLSCFQSHAFQQVLLRGKQIKRIFKLSGRYIVDSDFDARTHREEMYAIRDDFHHTLESTLYSFDRRSLPVMEEAFRVMKSRMMETGQSLEEAMYQQSVEQKWEVYHPVVIGVRGKSHQTGQVVKR